MHCSPCGNLVNYVDDGTYSFASKNPVTLSNTDQDQDQHKIISNYMESNKLVINADSTHLVVMGKKKVDNLRDQVQLIAGQHTIAPCLADRETPWLSHPPRSEV